MALAPGTKIGHYRIVSPLGAGGMGEVYRAEDTKLKREVAIKVLPEAFASDETRMARFQREAEVLASLNHPNIAAIYGLEQSPQPERSAKRSGVAEREAVGVGPHGTRRCALILELVEGPTLAERIASGPLPLEDALSIARQLSVGLEAAHDKSIVHRDLKPANIKLTHDGDVKILDFGLAKAMEGETPDVEDSNSPTLTRAATQAGVLFGTAAYMSPEQAKGKPVDRRADVWAFGAVLYEMLTGRRAFAGEDVSETLAFVLTKEPEWAALPDSTPEALLRVLRFCLSKDPKKRLRSVGDALLMLEGEQQAPLPSKAPLSSWIVAVAAALLAGALGWNLKPEAAKPVVRVVATPPSSEPLNLGSYGSDVAITQDGTRIVYAATVDGRRQLVVRAMDELSTTPLVTDNVTNLSGPILSPDGNWVAYLSGGTLRRVSIDGGPSATLCDVPGGVMRGASWGDDGTIVFAVWSGLWRVSSGGGTPVELTKPGEFSHLWPEVLPESKAVLFTIESGSAETAEIALLSLSTGESRVLLSGSHPRYVPTEHIVYSVDATLWAVGFDLEKLELTSDPVPVLEGAVTTGGAANFSISADGSLVYIEGSLAGAKVLVWVDREGLEEPVGAPKRAYNNLQLSPDGRRLAVGVLDQQNDIWIWEFARETLTRLTFDPGREWLPSWTPDGERIAYAAGNPPNVFWKAAAGTGDPERLTESASRQFPLAFSPDAKRLALLERNMGEDADDLRILLLDDERSSAPLLATAFNETSAAISPDGHFIAYQSNESGRPEVYLRPFPNVEDARWQVSRDGGHAPLWARSGRELFYMTRAGQLMSVSVQTSPEVTFGQHQLLFEQAYFRSYFGRNYDVSPDGDRFLMIKEEGVSDAALILVQNWGEELKRLLPR